jgi:hypothetical protein
VELLIQFAKRFNELSPQRQDQSFYESTNSRCPHRACPSQRGRLEQVAPEIHSGSVVDQHRGKPCPVLSRQSTMACSLRSSCYWATVNSSADCACVFTIADFRINFARVGTQTHMDFSELPPCRDWEPMPTMTNRATVNRAKRLMG